jgi:hypothetical protein
MLGFRIEKIADLSPRSLRMFRRSLMTMKQFSWIYRSGARLLTTLLVFLLPLSMADLGGAASSSPTWGNASLIPGASVLNVGKYSDLAFNSISCTSQGNCAAGGTYKDASGVIEGFVADQVNGVWNKAEEIPGLGAIGDGGISVNSLSCASPGNCSAGGAYESSGVSYGFLVNEVSGVWENVETIGISSLGGAAFTAVSCPSAGNCTQEEGMTPGSALRTSSLMSRMGPGALPSRSQIYQH